MQLIDYNDTCVVTRPTGTTDEWDNIVSDDVYSGKCLYAESRITTPEGLIVHVSEVFLPSNEVLIYPNDKIHVETQTGRNFDSVIGEVRDIRLTRITGLHYTKLVLTQNQETRN